VFLGDSETFGESLRENETVPGHLEAALNAAGGQRFEVLNFGVVAYNTGQEFALLKKRSMQFDPSIVVLYYVFNDPEIAAPIAFTKAGSPGVSASPAVWARKVGRWVSMVR
jgi:hypothetical protein